jgi:protein KRI1
MMAKDVGDDEEPVKELTHVEQQALLKKELKTAISLEFGEDDEEDAIFSLKEKTDDDLKKEDTEYREFLLKQMGTVSSHEVSQI